MRVCKTPALGGKKYTCQKCKHAHYVYFGCGNSRCSICQSVKREQWIDKLQSKLLDVAYVHLITTMPHQLNSLARSYPAEMYNILFRVTRDTVFELARNPTYLGAKPGLISIIHTFGSDMKYHVHIHSLMTFGGIDHKGQWRYPKLKKKLCPHFEFRNAFRKNFIQAVRKSHKSGAIKLKSHHLAILKDLETKKWSYFVTKPSMSTETIELYLARYINRIAVSNSRLTYLKQTKEIRLIHNDYKHQIEGQAAPKKTKPFDPLSFIHQYLMHVLPPYFQKSRRYGIHANATQKKYQTSIQRLLRNNGSTIRTVIEIITHLLKAQSVKCEKCGHTEFEIEGLPSDSNYIHSFLNIPKPRAP